MSAGAGQPRKEEQRAARNGRALALPRADVRQPCRQQSPSSAEGSDKTRQKQFKYFCTDARNMSNEMEESEGLIQEE